MAPRVNSELLLVGSLPAESAESALRAAGVAPPSRQLMVMLLGGLRELIATTVEDGGDIGGITEVAVRATQALLDPTRRPRGPVAATAGAPAFPGYSCDQ